jgi:hypothetical protein
MGFSYSDDDGPEMCLMLPRTGSSDGMIIAKRLSPVGGVETFTVLQTTVTPMMVIL